MQQQVTPSGSIWLKKYFISWGLTPRKNSLAQASDTSCPDALYGPAAPGDHRDGSLWRGALLGKALPRAWP